jgi:hypothetical protein
VASELVAARDDLPTQLDIPLDLLSHAEEGGRRLAARKQLEQSVGAASFRPVVEGEREPPAASRAADDNRQAASVNCSPRASDSKRRETTFEIPSRPMLTP